MEVYGIFWWSKFAQICDLFLYSLTSNNSPATQHVLEFTPEVVWRDDVQEEVDGMVTQSDGQNENLAERGTWS